MEDEAMTPGGESPLTGPPDSPLTLKEMKSSSQQNLNVTLTRNGN